MKEDPIASALSRPEDDSPHLIVEARAGTGKTTTLVEGLRVLRRLGTELAPSEQQARIWNSLALSPADSSVCFVAFNKNIAAELKERVPKDCDAMTMHSMGFRAVRSAFSGVKVDDDRVFGIIAEILGKDLLELRRRDFELLRATKKLVSLCKMNLIGVDNENTPLTDSIISRESLVQEVLPGLASHYDVDLNGDSQRVFDLIPRVLERCKDVGHDNSVDFDDMVWLPVVLARMPMTRYDLLLVDEAQDLNRCQQQLALKAGRRLVLCGDSHQAVYGFAGADSESMRRMLNTLRATDRGCEELPLTVTRRCGRAIVEKARRYVPDFEAHETCCDGLVKYVSFAASEATTTGGFAPGGIEAGQIEVPGYQESVKNGDMILCRVNAPLVSECFKFLRVGRKADIQGRDVGQGLIATIKKMNTPLEESTTILLRKLSLWFNLETRRENAKRSPDGAKLIALQDRYDCLCCFAEGQTTVEMVVKRIDSVFTDEKQGDGIKLSSIHKAKGLEADRVFLLQPKGAAIPHPMARTPWQMEQEMNLLYVAITRAKTELIYVG